MNWIKDNWFKIILAVCALVIAFGYLWNITQPKEKYYFIKLNNDKILKCNRITGSCSGRSSFEEIWLD